jgi:hypothetical protein
MSKKMTFYIILIIVILVLLFFSQQAYSGLFIKRALSGVSDQASAYLAKGSNWITSKIYPEITKQNISDSVKKVEDYFSGITNSILHPGENTNCQNQPIQTSSSRQ